MTGLRNSSCIHFGCSVRELAESGVYGHLLDRMAEERVGWTSGGWHM